MLWCCLLCHHGLKKGTNCFRHLKVVSEGISVWYRTAESHFSLNILLFSLDSLVWLENAVPFLLFCYLEGKVKGLFAEYYTGTGKKGFAPGLQVTPVEHWYMEECLVMLRSSGMACPGNASVSRSVQMCPSDILDLELKLNWVGKPWVECMLSLRFPALLHFTVHSLTMEMMVWRWWVIKKMQSHYKQTKKRTPPKP